MQLKLKRSQREGGVISTTMVFCLDARVEFTPQEAERIRRYKLHNQVIYNSDASARHLARAEAYNDGSLKGSLRSLAATAMAATKLNISIASLERGQHVECKSLDELLGAEQAVITACENLKGYLDTAATFDGRMVVIDFETGAPVVVAQSASPALVAPAAAPHPPVAAPTPALAYAPGTPSRTAPELPPGPAPSSPAPSIMDMSASELRAKFEGFSPGQQLVLIGSIVLGIIIILVVATHGRVH